jgi:hypothetical protein
MSHLSQLESKLDYLIVAIMKLVAVHMHTNPIVHGTSSFKLIGNELMKCIAKTVHARK